MTVKALGLNHLLTKSHAIVSRPPPQPSPLHFDDTTCPMRRYEALGVSLHTQASRRQTPSAVLFRLLELCCPHRNSIGPHSPILVGKTRADRRRTRRNFPVVTVAPGRLTGSRLHRVRRRPHQLQRSPSSVFWKIPSKSPRRSKPSRKTTRGAWTLGRPRVDYRVPCCFRKPPSARRLIKLGGSACLFRSSRKPCFDSLS